MKNLSATIVAIFTFAGVTFPAIASVISPLGSAAENTAAIQAALDAAAGEAVPGAVTLGEGTFEINAQLMVTGGVTLVGQGWESTIIKQTIIGTGENAANGRCATVSGGATIKGITLTGGHIRAKWIGGAGVLVDNGTVSQCRITGNQLGDAAYQNVAVNNVFGAGVGFYGGAGGVIEHSVITGNSSYANGGGASHGGGVGIYNVSSAILIDTCLISGNSAPSGNGGGCCAEYGNPIITIRNTTVTKNVAGSKGGGIYDGTWNHKIQAKNTIIFNNKADIEDPELSGELLSESSNNLIGLDPLFVDAVSGDYHLSSASPCIGAGVAYEGIGLDLDGVSFSDPPSIGCYEVGDVAENPQFAVASGSIFFPTMNVALTCATEGAKIYYTTDGSNPTESSELYTAPFEISSTVTVKARAYAEGKGSSGVVSATYTKKRPTPKLKEFRKFIEITLRSDLYSGEDPVAGLPALVKLNETTIPGFRYSQFSLANGEDMMFVDENDKPIPHEVDTWNTKGESLIWVKIPSVSAQTKIKMYYGNGAISSEESHDVWTDFTGVWHLNNATAAAVEHSHGTYANSTEVKGIEGHVAQHAKVDESGRFGKCFRVNDSTGKQAGNFNYGGVWVNDSGVNSPIDGGKNFTISGWFKHDNFNYYWDHIFYKRKSSDNSNTKLPNNAFAIECNSQVDKPSPMPRGSGAGGNSATCSGDLRDWAYLTFVYDNQKCFVYENGIKVGESSITACTDNDSPLVFGNNCDVASGLVGDAAWNGWIDEVRFSKGSKSAEWVAAEFKAMNTGEEDIFVYGSAQVASLGFTVVVR